MRIRVAIIEQDTGYLEKKLQMYLIPVIQNR